MININQRVFKACDFLRKTIKKWIEAIQTLRAFRLVAHDTQCGLDSLEMFALALD